MVRAQAEDVVSRVRTLVGGSERAYVRRFRVRAGGAFQTSQAHLAPEVVERFDRSCQRRIPDNPRCSYFPAIRDRIAGRFLDDNLARSGQFWDLYQTKAPDLEPGLAPASTVLLDRVESVVAVAHRGRKGRRVSVTTDHTNREPGLRIVRECPISPGKGLIVYLLPGGLISSSVPGVDDHIPVIRVVFLATGEDYRFRALGLASGDAGLDRHVDPALAQFGTTLEQASFRIPGHMSEETFWHADAYRIIRS
jgi:hypothetical protein